MRYTLENNSGRYIKAGVAIFYILVVESSMFYNKIGSNREYATTTTVNSVVCLKKNLNAPRPPEHPPVGGEKYVKTFS